MPDVPFVPAGVDHLVLWVDDLEAARTWYSDVLGCKPGFDYPDIAMTHLWYGPVLIGLWDRTDARAAYAAPREVGENLHHIALAWQGASETQMRDHLAAQGVTIVKSLRQVGARGFGLALYLRDPWGNLIELKGPPEYMAEQP